MNSKKQMKSSGDLRIVSKETSYFDVHRISLLAIMTAFATVGRLMFSVPFLANIQPMTALLILITLNIGVIDGLVVAALSMLLTNMMLGMGPWTILQIIAFGVVILLTGILKYIYRFGTIMNRIVFMVWALLAGFIYGFIVTFLSYHLYGMSNFLVYYINGLPFDVLHAVGNVGFFLILEPIIVPIIRKKIEETTL